MDEMPLSGPLTSVQADVLRAKVAKQHKVIVRFLDCTVKKMDSVRTGVKYILFDLEATKRERDQARERLAATEEELMGSLDELEALAQELSVYQEREQEEGGLLEGEYDYEYDDDDDIRFDVESDEHDNRKELGG